MSIKIGIDPVLALAKRTDAVKAECRKRIMSTANATAQMNMTAAASAGRMDAPQLQTWGAALAWVDAMRSACPTLIANAAADYLGDAAWPAIPEGVPELVSSY